MRDFSTKFRSYRYRCFISLLFVLLVPSLALASEHSPIRFFIWQSIDLVLFFSILLLINHLKGNLLRNAWIARKTIIARQKRVATDILEKSEKKAENIREKMANIEQAVADAVAKIKQETELEKNNLIQKSEKKIQILRAQMNEYINLERSAAENKVRCDLNDSVMQSVVERVKQESNYNSDRIRRFATIDVLKTWKSEHNINNLGI